MKVFCLLYSTNISLFFSYFGNLLISIAAKIGEGILLDHGTGVVIGETAVVGNRVSLMQVSQFHSLLSFHLEFSLF